MPLAQHWQPRHVPSVLGDGQSQELGWPPDSQERKQVQVCHLFVVFIIFDLAF
jgi:hypothetical protein